MKSTAEIICLIPYKHEQFWKKLLTIYRFNDLKSFPIYQFKIINDLNHLNDLNILNDSIRFKILQFKRFK